MFDIKGMIYDSDLPVKVLGVSTAEYTNRFVFSILDEDFWFSVWFWSICSAYANNKGITNIWIEVGYYFE